MPPLPYSQGVPSVEPQVSVPDNYLRIQSTPAEFGGLIGQGEQALGAGALKAGQFYGQVAADNATNQYMEGARKIIYGDPDKPWLDATGNPILDNDGKPQPDRGLIGLQGDQAMRAGPQKIKELDDLRKRLGAGLLTGDSQLKFDAETRRMQSYHNTQIGAHIENEAQKWAGEVEKARVYNHKIALGQAVLAGDQPEIDRHTQDIIGAHVAQASRLGGGNELLNQAVNLGKAEAAETSIEALMPTDPQKARALLEANRSVLAGVGKYDALDARTKAHAFKSEVDGLVSGALAAPARPTTGAGLGQPGTANFAKTSGIFGDPRAPNFEAQNITTVASPSGASFRVNKLAAPAFEGFLKDLEAEGYKINPTQSGGYNLRNIRGGTELSEHAYGNAIDINSDKNLYSKDGNLVTDLPANVRALAQKWNLSWGGDWHDLKDAMHFEWAGPKPSFENNVGNVKANAPGSYGAGGPRNEYATFATPEQGAAAATAALIHNAQEISSQGGTPTFRTVISQYAPRSDGNDPDAYAQTVAQAVGMRPDDPMPIGDPTKMASIVQAVARRGEGKQLDPAVATRGVQLAMAGGTAAAAAPAQAPGTPPVAMPIPSGMPNAATVPPPHSEGLAAALDHIQQSDASPEAKELASQRIERRYRALEADDSRYQAAVARQTKQVSEAAENEYIAADSKLTAAQASVDARLTPEAKMRMIGYINRADKPDPLTRVSQQTTTHLLEDMRRDPGDPKRIEDTGPIYDAFIHSQLSRADFDFLTKQFADIRSPQGEKMAVRQKEFMSGIKPLITKSNPLMGAQDPIGDPMYYMYQWTVDHKIDDYRKAGKDPFDLFDPTKPDYVGSPAFLKPFQTSFQQSMRQKAGSVSGAPVPPAYPEAPTAAPAIIPRTPGESPADYLKRIGSPVAPAPAAAPPSPAAPTIAPPIR